MQFCIGDIKEHAQILSPAAWTAAMCFTDGQQCDTCRSTGKVANLTIKATLSNCILHRRGKVTVEACKLQCYAGGLEHLFTPLVTLASAGLRVQRNLLTRPMLTGREAGMGVLSVVETKIRVSQCTAYVVVLRTEAEAQYMYLLPHLCKHCVVLICGNWYSQPGHAC